MIKFTAHTYIQPGAHFVSILGSNLTIHAVRKIYCFLGHSCGELLNIYFEIEALNLFVCLFITESVTSFCDTKFQCCSERKIFPDVPQPIKALAGDTEIFVNETFHSTWEFTLKKNLHIFLANYANCCPIILMIA